MEQFQIPDSSTLNSLIVNKGSDFTQKISYQTTVSEVSNDFLMSVRSLAASLCQHNDYILRDQQDGRISIFRNEDSSLPMLFVTDAGQVWVDLSDLDVELVTAVLKLIFSGKQLKLANHNMISHQRLLELLSKIIQEEEIKNQLLSKITIEQDKLEYVYSERSIPICSKLAKIRFQSLCISNFKIFQIDAVNFIRCNSICNKVAFKKCGFVLDSKTDNIRLSKKKNETKVSFLETLNCLKNQFILNIQLI